MAKCVTKSSLSESRRRLVETLSQLNHGRIEGLNIKGGEPVFDPLPRIIAKMKMGGESGPRPEAELPDCWLKEPVISLLEIVERLGDGEIQVIEVKYALPFTVEVVQTALGAKSNVTN